MNRVVALLFLWASIGTLHAAKKNYFAQYARPLTGNWSLHKWVKQPLYVVNSKDSMPINYYFIYQRAWYAKKLRTNELFELKGNNKFAVSKAQESVLLKHIAWRRYHYRYHGFVGWLTLILAVPSLFFLLLPGAMWLVNFIVIRSSGQRVFGKTFRWWIVLPLAILWFLEYWLCHNPQSF